MEHQEPSLRSDESCAGMRRRASWANLIAFFEASAYFHCASSLDVVEPDAEVAELVDALDSKSSLAHTKWGFESPLRHTTPTEDVDALRIRIALLPVRRYPREHPCSKNSSYFSSSSLGSSRTSTGRLPSLVEFPDPKES